jgi:hypothetical protein
MSESNRDVGNPIAWVALVVALLGLAALFVMYWFPVPSALLGVFAIALGVLGRRRAIQGRGSRDVAVAAVVLGLVAILGNALAQRVSAEADKFGRDCVANYSADCPEWLEPRVR